MKGLKSGAGAWKDWENKEGVGGTVFGGFEGFEKSEVFRLAF